VTVPKSFLNRRVEVFANPKARQGRDEIGQNPSFLVRLRLLL